MAITVTDRGFADHAGNWGTTATTASFTPSNDSLLVAFVWHANTSTTENGDASISGGSLTWTQQAVTTAGDTGGYEATLTVFTAPVVTGASMTVQVEEDGAGSTSVLCVQVVELTGEDALEQTFTDNFSGGSAGGYNDDFATALAGTDSVKFVAGYAYHQASTQAFIAETGWTEVVEKADADLNSAHFPHLIVAYDTGTTDTGIDLDTVPTGVSTYDQLIVGLEFSAAGGGGGNTLTVSQSESGDTTSATVQNLVELTSSVTEGGDTTAASIEVVPIVSNITSSVSETGDTSTASVQALQQITASVSESGDTTSSSINVIQQISASVAEFGDSTTSSLQVLGALSAAVDESGDATSALLTGGGIFVTAAVSEQGDSNTVSFVSPRNITASINEGGDSGVAVFVDPNTIILGGKKIKIISAQAN